MKYQICVSGSTAGSEAENRHKAAYEVGRAVSARGKTLITGATIGLPHHAAMGAKSVENGGLVVGFSPASSLRDHVAKYQLPTREFDAINFTGMEYVGRDVHLIRSADALITIGGRMGALHELSTALELRKVCGVLLGSGGLADFTKTLLEKMPVAGSDEVIYDTNPERLVEKVIVALNDKYSDFEHDNG